VEPVVGERFTGGRFALGDFVRVVNSDVVNPTSSMIAAVRATSLPGSRAIWKFALSTAMA